MLLLPDLAMHVQRRIRVRLQLGNQAGLQRREFLGGPTWDRLYLDLSCLSSLLEIAFDRGSRDPEQLDNLRSWIALIHCLSYSLS